MLEQLTSRNVRVKIFSCSVNIQTKDCALSQPFQHKLQHHCFHGKVSLPVPQLTMFDLKVMIDNKGRRQYNIRLTFQSNSAFIPTIPALARSNCASVFKDATQTSSAFKWTLTSPWQSLSRTHCTFVWFWILDPQLR